MFKRFFKELLRLLNCQVGAFGTFCPAVNSGRKVGNADVDTNAAIATSKLGTRTMTDSIPIPALEGLTITYSGVFPEIAFDKASDESAYATWEVPGDWAETGNIVIELYHTCDTVIVNDVIWAVDVKSTTVDGTTATERQETATTTVNGVAGQITKSTLTFAAAYFAAGDIVGIKITRDADNASDTADEDVNLVAVRITYTARG